VKNIRKFFFIFGFEGNAWRTCSLAKGGGGCMEPKSLVV